MDERTSSKIAGNRLPGSTGTLLLCALPLVGAQFSVYPGYARHCTSCINHTYIDIMNAYVFLILFLITIYFSKSYFQIQKSVSLIITPPAGDRQTHILNLMTVRVPPVYHLTRQMPYCDVHYYVDCKTRIMRGVLFLSPIGCTLSTLQYCIHC